MGKNCVAHNSIYRTTEYYTKYIVDKAVKLRQSRGPFEARASYSRSKIAERKEKSCFSKTEDFLTYLFSGVSWKWGEQRRESN